MAGRAMRALKTSVQERMREMVESGLLSHGTNDQSYWIRDAEWSDYSGTVYTRSNARSLARDYPEVVTESWRGGHGWSGAYISASVLNDAWAVGVFDIADRVNAVLDIIESLAEYPVYDEEDMSALESEILNEDFDSWGRSEMEREANKRAGYPDVEIELNEDKAREAFHKAAEGSGFTATSSDVRDHAERALDIYNTL
jgi:hypothetical protein